jgi:hypothetical protein
MAAMNPANSARMVPRSWTRIGVAVDGLGEGGPTRVGAADREADDGTLAPAAEGLGEDPPHATTMAATTTMSARHERAGNGEADRGVRSASSGRWSGETVTCRPP